MRRLFLLAAASLFALVAAPDHARAQAEVYDPAAPRGSAHVRIVNALPGELQLRTDFLPALRLGSAGADRIGAYTVVENVQGRALRIEVMEGNRRGRGTVTAQPGGFTTVIVHRGAGGNPAVTAIQEDTDFNRARARLAFYNTIPDCAAGGVLLQPGGQAVFADVPALAGRVRSVNPVAAQVRTSCGGRLSAAFALQGLEPGGLYSIWMMPGAGGAPAAFLSTDVVAPYRR